MSTPTNYFAYGSNMFVPRLRDRVPSAVVIGVYTLPEHQLKFHKRSDKDGSGKCDVFFTGDENDFVVGILFEIDGGEEKVLDKFEGLGKGYEKKNVTVANADGENETAFTYYADKKCIDESLRPLHWYKQHVLAGAIENGLPDDYVEKIESVADVFDADEKRAQTEMALHEPDDDFFDDFGDDYRDVDP